MVFTVENINSHWASCLDAIDTTQVYCSQYSNKIQLYKIKGKIYEYIISHTDFK